MILINFNLDYYQENEFLPVGYLAVLSVLFSAPVFLVHFIRLLADKVVRVVQTQLK